jgi:hypothetical protein
VIRFVVIGRSVADLKKYVHGDQFVLPQNLEMIRSDLANFDVVVVNRRVPEEFSEPFVEPRGNPRKLRFMSA